MPAKHKKNASWLDRLLGRDDRYEDELEEMGDEFDTFDDEETDEDLEDEFFDDDGGEKTTSAHHDGKKGAEELHINLVDKADLLIAQTLVPGLKENEIDIDLNREMLSITTNSNEHCVEKGGDYLYEELLFGSFSRSILLPAEIEVEESTAEVKDGVLTITMPKIDKAARKKIAIKKK